MSEQFHAVLRDATPIVEPIGLDEAFLDVSSAVRLLGPPLAIADQLRRRVRDELALDCSVGIGRSKLIAKLASRAAKPTASRAGKQPGKGVVLVLPEHELGFLHPMPVEALWGVGPATARRLHDLGVRTVADLAALPRDAVVRRVGNAVGGHLAALARGEDTDPVVPDRAAKSIGHEETFREDLYDRTVLDGHALRMAESVAIHLREGGLVARTVTVKVKYGDFTLVTRSHTVPQPVDTAPALGAMARALLDSVDAAPGVRLLGVSVSGLTHDVGATQLVFDLDAGAPTEDPGGEQAEALTRHAARLQDQWQEVTAAVDAIRRRFGRASVGTGAMVTDAGVEVPRRRDAPWGPSAED